MNKKIVVMGGSFNPPTKAHYKLLQFAVDQITTGASDESVKGIFIPSSDAYVSRKMSHQPSGADKTVLPEKLRFDMLQSFHEKDHRLSSDGRELGTTAVKGHTVETLFSIQRENPEAQVYFIFGGDKLEGLARWGSFEALVSTFKSLSLAGTGLTRHGSFRTTRSWLRTTTLLSFCKLREILKGSARLPSGSA